MIARVYDNYLGGSYVFVLEDGSWKLTDCDEFHDPRDALAKKYRPNGVNAIWDLADNVTVFTGLTGSVYLAKAQQTVTFDAMGGTCEMETYTGDVWSTVKLPTPVKSGAQFQGWYLDKAYTKLWTPPVVPAKPITVYAKWSDSDTGDKYAEDREKALKQLELALGRMDPEDYTDTNWQRVLTEYENGRYAISIAAPNPASDSVSDINKAVQDTIYAALNDAISRMNSIPMKRIKKANIVVSLDAQTLGLGYLIKPTCVTVDESTQASKVITDLIKQAVKLVKQLLYVIRSFGNFHNLSENRIRIFAISFIHCRHNRIMTQHNNRFLFCRVDNLRCVRTYDKLNLWENFHQIFQNTFLPTWM